MLWCCELFGDVLCFDCVYVFNMVCKGFYRVFGARPFGVNLSNDLYIIFYNIHIHIHIYIYVCCINIHPSINSVFVFPLYKRSDHTSST